MTRNVRLGWAPLALMATSGFAGLGYQIVWAQQAALWLGHESAAVLAVVTAFFGGISAGAAILGSRLEQSTSPLRWYAGCELVIALWSALLIFTMAPFSAWVERLIGVEPSPFGQWSVAFCTTFLVLLPATAAIGATLPAMECVSTTMTGRGQNLAVLYAANTFGGVVGVLAVALWLVPEFGLARATGFCAALNVLCAVASRTILQASPTEAPNTHRSAPAGDGRNVLICLAVTGLLGIGYEVLVVRVLSQVSEDTVYTFAMLLAIYLVGTAVGAAVYQRWLLPRGEQENLDESLLGALAATCLAGTATQWGAERVSTTARGAFGDGYIAAVITEAAPALLAFGPPTVAMGALFSHLARRARASHIGFGRALAVNTLGAAAAPVAFGVLVAPALGPRWTLLGIVASYLALVARRAWIRPVIWGPAVAALCLAVVTPALAFVDVPDGGRIVSYEDGVMAAVTVVEDAQGVARLRINNRAQEGTNRTQRVDGRQAWLPLLLHPAPRRALFLGLGTGVTASSAAGDPTLEVDAVELLPEVVRASAYFARSIGSDAAFRRLHMLTADARRYVRASDRAYDVIVSDNFHPARSGSGALYTVEHFEAVRLRLESGGVFCQWLPLHQLDHETLRSIVRSFVSVYPDGWAMIASNSLETPVIGLVGRRDESRFDGATVRERLSHVALPEFVASLGFEDELAVLGSFVASPSSLRRFSSGAVPNTDDRPVVAYRAPRITYAPDSSPRDRLIALLGELSITPLELIVSPADDAFARRLAAYRVARDRFIESGRDVRLSSSVEDMLAQVREPLLSVLRISPDFRPAYDPLLSMASALARSNAAAARALLAELSGIQPARNEAVRLLALLAENGDQTPPIQTRP